MPSTAGWLSLDGAAWGRGTCVTPWKVAGAVTHLPSSAGCIGEQGHTVAVSGCWEIQGGRNWHAQLFTSVSETG